MDGLKSLLLSAQQTSADLAVASIRQEKAMAEERARAVVAAAEVSTVQYTHTPTHTYT